jgi:hypothetical protein
MIVKPGLITSGQLMIVLFVAALCSMASAEAKSIDDCERFSNPLAYNQCLSQFSPARRHRAGDAPPQVGAAIDPKPGEPAPQYRGRRRGAPIARMPSLDSVVRPSGNGRSMATFEIGGGSPRPPAARRGTRHR